MLLGNYTKRLIQVMAFASLLLISSYDFAIAESLFSKSYLTPIEEPTYSEIAYSDSFETESSYEEVEDLVEETEEFNEDEITLGKPKELGLKELFFRIGIFGLIVLAFWFVAKAMLYKAHKSGEKLFNQPPGFFNGITDQFSGSFACLEGLKLRQMINLSKGQNLYLVELDKRKILLGGTHMGGIQFVADLSNIGENKISIDDQLEENSKHENFFLNALQKHNPFSRSEQKSNNLEPVMNAMQQEQIFRANQTPVITEEPIMEDPFKKTDEHMQVIENTRSSEESDMSKFEKKLRSRTAKRPFKRKVSFRQSLISG